MRDSSVEITRLCESCWERLADSTKIEQRSYAEELLGLLDWDQPIPFTPKEGAEALSAATYLLRGGGQTVVAVYFVPPGTLDPPSRVTERSLDFCPATRMLVNEAASMNVHYALVSDLYRSYLYDVDTDEFVLGADDPKAFNADFAPVLARSAMERGSLEELRRPPRSAVARHLREWMECWIDAIHKRTTLNAEQASLLLDRLLVVRYIFEKEILRRTKARLEQRFRELSAKAASPNSAGCGEELVKLFHDMWFDWRLDLFQASPDLDRALANDAVAAPLLQELGLHSQAKFSIATILESFNHGDPAEKMRVRMVPDINEERDHYLHRQSLETIDQARIEIDLMEDGYRAIFHWFDAMVGLYDRLEVEFDSKTYNNVPQAQELDLFAWSEMDSDRPRACADKLAYACRHGFGIYYNGPRQLRIARLLMTLHLVSRYAETRQAVNAFPSLDKVLIKRPRVLSSERVMNARPPLDPMEDTDPCKDI